MNNDELTLIKEIELLRINIAHKQKEYKQKRRPFLWYATVAGVTLLIAIVGFIGAGLFTNFYFSGWTGVVTFLLVIIFLGLVVYFFLDRSSFGNTYGFRGLARLKELISLREDIDDLQTNIGIKEKLLTYTRSPQKKYRDQLPLIIAQYQRRAKRNRFTHYTLQVFIILFSLLVTGLTSGFAGLVGINHWLWVAPVLSFTVSFLTAITTLFRFHSRGFNLQQTADAIEFEIESADLRIFDYNTLSDEEALHELAERAARLRNEQRKRQQQLEQSPETNKHTSA